jgi:hypothetical protein
MYKCLTSQTHKRKFPLGRFLLEPIADRLYVLFAPDDALLVHGLGLGVTRAASGRGDTHLGEQRLEFRAGARCFDCWRFLVLKDDALIVIVAQLYPFAINNPRAKNVLQVSGESIGCNSLNGRYKMPFHGGQSSEAARQEPSGQQINITVFGLRLFVAPSGFSQKPDDELNV